MSTDEPAAILAGIKERYAKTGGGYSSNPGDYIRSAEDVPYLLAAVKAALAHHVEAVIDVARPRFHYCQTCSGHPAWPCPEVRDIRAALAGEEAGDA
jgi:hypothetical protein